MPGDPYLSIVTEKRPHLAMVLVVKPEHKPPVHALPQVLNDLIEHGAAGLILGGHGPGHDRGARHDGVCRYDSLWNAAPVCGAAREHVDPKLIAHMVDLARGTPQEESL